MRNYKQADSPVLIFYIIAMDNPLVHLNLSFYQSFIFANTVLNLWKFVLYTALVSVENLQVFRFVIFMIYSFLQCIICAF